MRFILAILALGSLCLAQTAVIPTVGFLDDAGYSKTPVPPGAIILLLSGSCPTGYTEAAALNGKFLQGTVAANGDVGQTGGNATITPAGTVSAPVFTGTSNQTTSATSAGTPAGTNSTAAFTPAGTNGTTTTGGTAISGTATAAIVVTTGTGNNVSNNTHTHPSHTHTVPAETFTGSAGTVPAETFTGSALATHTHTLTPAGTNSQPSFTGAAIDPRPAFVKVIFCTRN